MSGLLSLRDFVMRHGDNDDMAQLDLVIADSRRLTFALEHGLVWITHDRGNWQEAVLATGRADIDAAMKRQEEAT